MRTCPTALRTVALARRSLAGSSPMRGTEAGFRLARRLASGTAGSSLKQTPLYDLHLARGGKMVPFAGFSMPVQYASASLTDSHHFTRQHASLFDVSHMVQHIFKGPDAAAFLERVTPSSWASLPPMQGRLTTFLWPQTGGIVDDSIVTRLGDDEFYVVTNGACLDKDSQYLDRELGAFGGRVEWHRLDGSGLVALQGPQAAEVLTEVLASDLDLDRLYFGSAAWADLKLAGGGTVSSVLVSRGGYTGEDGFELSFRNASRPARETTPAAVEALLQAGGPQRLQLAGLGARDSLRLEAGMCLYGHDLDDSTTPVEAGLSWVVGRDRRASGGFHGAEVIIPQLTAKSKGGRGVERRRVGLLVEGAPAREGAAVEKEGQPVGRLTSGGPSPTLGRNIAMGYLADGLHKAGTELEVVVRGRRRKAVVTKMPFVAPNYHKPSDG